MWLDLSVLSTPMLPPGGGGITSPVIGHGIFLIQGLCEEAMNRKNTLLLTDELIEFEE
jgi:hypothetical protein